MQIRFMNRPIIFIDWDNKTKLVPASFSCFSDFSWKDKVLFIKCYYVNSTPEKWDPRPKTVGETQDQGLLGGTRDPGPHKWDIGPGTTKRSSGTWDLGPGTWSGILINNFLDWKSECCNESIAILLEN